MATIIVETDDGDRIMGIRVTSRGQYLACEDSIRVSVIKALEREGRSLTPSSSPLE